MFDRCISLKEIYIFNYKIELKLKPHIFTKHHHKSECFQWQEILSDEIKLLFDDIL